jgi:hypothetical protein
MNPPPQHYIEQFNEKIYTICNKSEASNAVWCVLSMKERMYCKMDIRFKGPVKITTLADL